MKITNVVLIRGLEGLLRWYVKRIERQIARIDRQQS